MFIIIHIVINIEEIVLDDADEIYQIENESFKYSWSISQINSELVREKN